mgnify:FL=1
MNIAATLEAGAIELAKAESLGGGFIPAGADIIFFHQLL